MRYGVHTMLFVLKNLLEKLNGLTTYLKIHVILFGFEVCFLMNLVNGVGLPLISFVINYILQLYISKVK
jgi:hypothetical protein